MQLRYRSVLIVIFVALVGLSLGALNEQASDFAVELTWQGSADLDLVVTTPSGYRISYANQTAGGGTLQADTHGYCVDALQQPVERVTFPATDSASGEYFVSINYALPCGEDGSAVRWHLTVHSGGAVTERSGEVILGQSLPIGRFARG